MSILNRFGNCFFLRAADRFFCHTHQDNAPVDVWESFYHSKYVGDSQFKSTNQKIEAGQQDIYVSDSSFLDQNDGSIIVNSNSIKFFHSNCLFHNCTRNSYGGSVYIKGDNRVIQYRVCAISSKITQKDGLFSYTEIVYDSDNENYLIQSTVSNCVEESRSHTISMNCGNTGVHSSNISKNSVSFSAAFYMVDTKGICMINFSTFENNVADSMCLEHAYASDGFHNYFSNIINNSQKMKNAGIVTIDQSVLIVKNCTILGDFGNGSAFYSTKTLKIINCNVDDDFSYSNNKPQTI